MSDNSEFDKLFGPIESAFAQAEKKKGWFAGLGCVGITLILTVSVAFWGLVIWGLWEFVHFLIRH